jgi:pimeloyl-ACP methyl ester carboxylesterase
VSGAGVRKFVEVDGRQLSYLEWGRDDKSVLLLLHGFGQEAASWAPVAEQFKGDYRVVALDARGHGHSDWHPDGDYEWESFSQDLASFHQALGLGQVFLVGHSMGGQHATPFVARNPQIVAAFVLEDIGPRYTEDVMATTAEYLKTPLEFASWDEAIDYMEGAAKKSAAILEGPKAAESPAIREIVVRRAEEQLIRHLDGKITWRTDVAGLQTKRRHHDPLMAEGQWPEFERLARPTLVIRGGRSNVIRAEVAERMKLNPNVTLIEVPDAGHTLHRENLPKFKALVMEFFSKVRE